MVLFHKLMFKFLFIIKFISNNKCITTNSSLYLSVFISYNYKDITKILMIL